MIRWVLMALFLLVAAPASADELRPGYIEFTQTGEQDWTLIWKSPMKSGVTPNTKPVLPSNCEARGNPSRALTNTAFLTTYKIICNGNVAGHEIGLSGFEASQTDALIRVSILGRKIQAMRITAAQPRALIRSKPGSWQVARTYFATGVDHIIFGFDHLLFVIALVLLLSGIWPVAKAVTAFTIAHSITLIGTTLGLFGLPQRPVEAIIALSILFLAVEIIKRDPAKPRLSERLPWIVAFLFGLLHGFGFAGALKEIGLPESDVPTALLTFNLGVETGQLAIVAICLLILAALKKHAQAAMRPAIAIATYAIGITASFWFFERVLT